MKRKCICHRLISVQILFKILVLSLFSLVNIVLNTWEVFEDRDGNFAILAPGDFELKTKQIETTLGEITCNTFIHQPTDKKANNKLYMINYCDYPEFTFPLDSIALHDEFLEISIEQELENLKGELSYTHKANLGPYTGKIYRIVYNDGGALMKSKIFIIKDRFYSIQVYTTEDKRLNFDMDKYLDSFRLLTF